jgi:hypothetical protein
MDGSGVEESDEEAEIALFASPTMGGGDSFLSSNGNSSSGGWKTLTAFSSIRRSSATGSFSSTGSVDDSTASLALATTGVACAGTDAAATSRNESSSFKSEAVPVP